MEREESLKMNEMVMEVRNIMALGNAIGDAHVMTDSHGMEFETLYNLSQQIVDKARVIEGNLEQMANQKEKIETAPSIQPERACGLAGEQEEIKRDLEAIKQVGDILLNFYQIKKSFEGDEDDQIVFTTGQTFDLSCALNGAYKRLMINLKVQD